MDLSKINYDKSKNTDLKPKVNLLDKELKKHEQNRRFISGNNPDLNKLAEQMAHYSANPLNDNITKTNMILSNLIDIVDDLKESSKSEYKRLDEQSKRQSELSDSRYRINLFLTLISICIASVALTFQFTSPVTEASTIGIENTESEVTTTVIESSVPEVEKRGLEQP